MRLINCLLICSSLIATYIKHDYLSPYKAELNKASSNTDAFICKLNKMRIRWSLSSFTTIDEFAPIIDTIASKLSYRQPLSKSEIERNFIEKGLKVEKYTIQYLKIKSDLDNVANSLIYYHTIFDQLSQFDAVNYKMVNGNVVILFTKLKDYTKGRPFECSY